MAEGGRPRAARARIASPLLAALAAAGPAAAVELPGAPGPRLLGGERFGVRWGNDGLGAGGGTASDDFRTNALTATWDAGPWFLSADHSLLTSKNPTGSPVAWGAPDPYAHVGLGKARRDELTLSAGVRIRGGGGALAAWAQAGAGMVCAGRLGGDQLQDKAHIVLGSEPSDLPYEDDGFAVDALVHAGAGLTARVAGPLRAAAGAVATAQTGGFARVRAESALVVAGPGGGLWLGCRWTDRAGDAPSLVAAVVAEHERGPGLAAGLGFVAGATRWSFEIERNLRNDGQYGAIAIAWAPPQADAAADGDAWAGRYAVVAPDSRAGGRGVEFALMRAWDAAGAPSLRLGVRDGSLEQPYTLDLVSRRLQVWLGPGVQPELAALGPLRLFADLECGVGLRWSQAMSNGYKVFGAGDGTHRVEHAAAIARAAAGLGVRWVPRSGPAIGLQVLVEQTAAPTRTETVRVRSPVDGQVIASERMAMEGSAWAPMAAVTVAWRW